MAEQEHRRPRRIGTRPGVEERQAGDRFARQRRVDARELGADVIVQREEGGLIALRGLTPGDRREADRAGEAAGSGKRVDRDVRRFSGRHLLAVERDRAAGEDGRKEQECGGQEDARVVSRIDGWPFLSDVQQFDVEDEHAARLVRRPGFAVGEVARDPEAPLLAGDHELQPLRPAWNNPVSRNVAGWAGCPGAAFSELSQNFPSVVHSV